MIFLGRRFSNWWSLLLLVLIPVLTALMGFVAIGLFAASHFVGAIFGPPAIWQLPLTGPSRDDIVGSYHEIKRNWQGGVESPRAALQLNNDGTMIVTDLPDSNGITNCVLSGSGRWNVPKDENAHIDLIIARNDSASTCKLESLPYLFGNILSVVGHSKPYRLYWVLGDPDSGEGIWFQRD